MGIDKDLKQQGMSEQEGIIMLNVLCFEFSGLPKKTKTHRTASFAVEKCIYSMPPFNELHRLAGNFMAREEAEPINESYDM